MREEAAYIKPDDAWGLKVWKTTHSQEMINQSLAKHDSFYLDAHKIFTNLQRRFGQFVVFDLHSYNHRREGLDSQPADPEQNPEVNVGTGTMLDRNRWDPIIDRFVRDLSNYNFLGRHLDVRENVKFYGRQFAQWTHEIFSDSVFDGIFIIDSQKDKFSVIYANQSFQTMTGFSKKEILGKDYFLLYGAATDVSIVDEIKHTLRGGKPFHGEMLHFRKNDEKFWNYLRIAPVMR